MSEERRLAWLRRAAGVVLVAGFVACAAEGGSAPADPTLLDPGVTQGSVTSTTGDSASPTTADVDGRDDAVPAPDPDDVPTTAQPSASSTRSILPGFGEVVVQVRRVDGQVVEWCLLLAETPEQRARGLMEVADPTLGGYAGMLFRFEDSADDVGFYMRNTAQPISIAYIGDDGSLVSTAEMAPCEDVDGCPTYPADGPVRWAVEVPAGAGGVTALGIEPGVTVIDTGRACAAGSSLTQNPDTPPAYDRGRADSVRSGPAATIAQPTSGPAPPPAGPRPCRVHREETLADASVRIDGHHRW